MKNLLLFLFCTVLSFNAIGQFGVRAGVNLANVSISPDDEETSYKSKLGFGLGVYYNYSITEKLSLQPEANFMQQGTKFDFDFFGVKLENSIGFNYLQIPIMLRYDVIDRIAIQAGPYFGYGIGKVKSETCLDGDCEKEDLEYDSNGEEGPKQLDFGLQFGLSVKIIDNLAFDARYILGLNNLNGEEDSSLKHNGINLSVAYSF